jgi:nitrile hydratase subunit alpha
MHGEHDHHDHHHDGDDHDPIEDEGGPPSEFELLEQAIRELLIEKGVVTAAQIQRQIDDMDSRTPMHGQKIVVRAWTDPAFKERLLVDAKRVIHDEYGIDLERSPEVMAVENTPGVHNVIVCTLCSCYPRLVLGIPPAWYKKKAYRSRVVKEPRKVLEEFGTLLPEETEIRVHDSTADLRYLVIPRRPEGTEGWSAERLAALVTRDSMIGVTEARAPATVAGD